MNDYGLNSPFIGIGILALVLTFTLPVYTKLMINVGYNITETGQPEYKSFKGIITDAEFIETHILLIFTGHMTKFTVNGTIIIFATGWYSNVKLGEMYEFRYRVQANGETEKTPSDIKLVDIR